MSGRCSSTFLIPHDCRVVELLKNGNFQMTEPVATACPYPKQVSCLWIGLVTFEERHPTNGLIKDEYLIYWKI